MVIKVPKPMRRLLLFTLPLFLTPGIGAATLSEAVRTTLETNPAMQQRISDYRSTLYDLDKAKAGYKPTVELSGAIGPEHTDKKEPKPEVEEELTRREASLTVTENLFNGFNTLYDVREQEARVEAARYYALQYANALSLDTTEKYLSVLHQKNLLDLERENVKTHERIYSMTKEKLTAGIGRRSDLEQTQARTALAYSNYIAQVNNYQDTIVNFERLYGAPLPAESLETPDANGLPSETLERVEALALEQNPTLRIETANVASQEAKKGKEQSGYYPRVDAELSADYKNNIDGDTNDDRAYRAMLRLYYNLYNGGRDEATRLQNLQRITSQQLSLSEQERAVVEKLKLAWLSYQYFSHRIRCLELHAELSKKTAGSYSEEYHLGRRSLLDLLNVELEYNDALKSLADARYEHTLAYYRILDAAGLITHRLVPGLYDTLDLERPDAVTYTPDLQARPFQYGESGDIDISETCKEAFVPLKQTLFDPDAETVPATATATTPLPGVPSDATPAIIIDETGDGAPVIQVSNVHFAYNSAELTDYSRKNMAPVVEKMRNEPEIIVEVHGHTDNTGSHEYNQYLSEARALSVKSALVEEGIAETRIFTFGHSFDQPVADNSTREGRRMNRRIEFILKRPEGLSE